MQVLSPRSKVMGLHRIGDASLKQTDSRHPRAGPSLDFPPDVLPPLSLDVKKDMIRQLEVGDQHIQTGIFEVPGNPAYSSASVLDPALRAVARLASHTPADRQEDALIVGERLLSPDVVHVVSSQAAAASMGVSRKCFRTVNRRLAGFRMPGSG